MKYLFILMTNFLISPSLVDTTKYVILYDQFEALRPIPNDIETFWSDKSHFDTIIIQGGKIIRRLQNEIDKFKIINPRSIVHMTFSVNNAIIRYAGDVAMDTIYADQFFYFWKIKGELYEDKKRFFRDRFAVFFDKS